jgi:predicted TIM-barrel fold metal-dependent hydrolase
MSETQTRERTAANRFGVDYVLEAQRLGKPVCPIIDAHAHINGERAAQVYKHVCDLYGVERVYSQTQLAQADAVKAVMGDRISFVAIPEYMHEDKLHAFTDGFVENLDDWHARGARMVKFWGAPRLRDYVETLDVDPSDLLGFDSKWRLRVAERAEELGMMLMVHVADPDTWFSTMYKDSARYGTKRSQYESLERLLEHTGMPCLAAHMGGWPEDLDFLDGLLERHPKLILDTSATKWMIREISKHDRERWIAFLRKHAGRILFGSDIVTSDEHLTPTDPDSPSFGNQLANSESEAFDLYASRYWALRTMYETAYTGASNIADPDLHMVDPERFTKMDAPQLRGFELEKAELEILYRGATERTLDTWYADRGGWVQ